MSSKEEPSDADTRGNKDSLPAIGELKLSEANDDPPAKQKNDSGSTGEPGAIPSTSSNTCKQKVAGVSTSTWWDPGSVDDPMKNLRVPEFRHRPNCDCRRGRRSEPEVGSNNESSAFRLHLHTEVQDTICSGCLSEICRFKDLKTAKKDGKLVKKAEEEKCRRSKERRCTRVKPDDIQERPRRSAMERKRSVEASLTEAEEALYEDVLEVLTEAKEAACVSSQDDIVNDDKSKSDGQPSSDSASTDGADAKLLEFKKNRDLRLAVEPILDSLEELEDESLDPHRDVRLYIITDRLDRLYQQIEARWAETTDQICKDMNCRYSQFVADCRESLQKAEVKKPVLKLFRRDLAEARILLIALLHNDFHLACEAFKDWRASYIQRELELSHKSLAEGDRFSLLASVLRYEALKSLPNLDKRTDQRAVELWKALVVNDWRDVDGTFNYAK